MPMQKNCGQVMIKDLIQKNRSYRRFYEDVRVDIAALHDLVELARLSPSSANMQPLKYFLSCDEKTNGFIFPNLVWAGYLRGWEGPAEGERPSAYIVILGDTGIRKSFGCDHGIAAQSMLLGAVEKELGGCIVGSIKKEKLRAALNIAPELEILLVLALGKPRETVRIEDVCSPKEIKYWRDKDGVHHVPKRSLDDLIIN